MSDGCGQRLLSSRSKGSEQRRRRGKGTHAATIGLMACLQEAQEESNHGEPRNAAVTFVKGNASKRRVHPGWSKGFRIRLS